MVCKIYTLPTIVFTYYNIYCDGLTFSLPEVIFPSLPEGNMENIHFSQKFIYTHRITLNKAAIHFLNCFVLFKYIKTSHILHLF